jgi:hypothetical protein
MHTKGMTDLQLCLLAHRKVVTHRQPFTIDTPDGRIAWAL